MKLDKPILFDLDHTLINTTVMIKNLNSMLSRESNLTLNQIEKYHTKYIKSLPFITYFDYLEFINTIPLEPGSKDKILHNYLNDSKIFSKYQDVDEVLEELKRRGYKLGIFSEGVPHFQKHKLKHLKVSKYLEDKYIFIIQSKRSNEILDSLPHSIIIDDNIDVCNIVALHNRHKIIHLNIKNKGLTPESDNKVLNSITSIDSLKELLEIL